MKAGTIVLNRVTKPEFLNDVIKKGDFIQKRMNEIKAKSKIIGDVRGKGLMIGCEFINPKEKPDSLGLFPANGDAAAKVQKICFENKLIMEKGGRNGSVMRCLCALNVTQDEIEKAMNIFEDAVLQVNKEYQ